ncbi:AAA family ATPase [Candidatus Finniella inopinata]|nr:ATP-binding protein [Candidatus Finniella inopinata]
MKWARVENPMISFIGRKEELASLNRMSKMHGPGLAVIKGRRRIGKSRLIEEFAKDKIFFSFSGLPPTTNVTAQNQRDVFAREFAQIFKLPPLSFSDWSDAFNHLTNYITEKPTVILFDEISWMGSKDPTFVGKLKIWWDLYLQHKPSLTLIFCGSVSTWIEKNIINSTAFFGRISLKITLTPFSLPECGQFLKSIGFKGSPFEIYEILSITGGIPWYLEKIIPSETVDTNLKNLCFKKDSIFVQEFDRIFHDLFDGHGKTHKEIVQELGAGNKTLADLRNALNYPRSGTFSEIVGDLITSGFVTKHYQWSIKTGAISKQSIYRLSDCYLRFYLKYIEPNRQRIEQGSFQDVALRQLPGWEAIMGLQVESLLLENRPLLLKSIGINPADIANDNPYLRQQTTRHRGCQIDYLIQTKTHTLYMCEFKFKRRDIGPEIIDLMKDKVSRFSPPSGFGVAPVFFHLSDVSEFVYDKNYFYKTINIADLLESLL